MAMINLAADYGWGPYTLLLIFIVVVIVTTVGFFIVMATTKVKKSKAFSQNLNIILKLIGQ